MGDTPDFLDGYQAGYQQAARTLGEREQQLREENYQLRSRLTTALALLALESSEPSPATSSEDTTSAILVSRTA